MVRRESAPSATAALPVAPFVVPVAVVAPVWFPWSPAPLLFAPPIVVDQLLVSLVVVDVLPLATPPELDPVGLSQP